jgi:hypothetical protein
MPTRHGGKRYDLATLQLPAHNHLAGSINAMHLKD